MVRKKSRLPMTRAYAGRKASAIAAVRDGPTPLPGYSHITFDPDPALTRVIAPQDVLIMEGLGFPPRAGDVPAKTEPDLMIYLDADLAHIERWFLERFLRFWHAAEHDPSSFYAQFRHMSEPELITFAKSVWAGINLPNLENHILPPSLPVHLGGCAKARLCDPALSPLLVSLQTGHPCGHCLGLLHTDVA